MTQAKKTAKKTDDKMKQMIWITLAAVVVMVGLTWFSNMNSAVVPDSPVAFDYDNLPRLGKENAPVKIVEFGDFKCPACKVFSQEIVPELKKEYIDSGDVAVYFFNYTFLGTDSTRAAAAAYSVYKQNNEAFWNYYDAIYLNQGNERDEWATSEVLMKLAKDANLPIDHEKFMKELQDETYLKEIEEQNAFVSSINVTQTPTLYINGQYYAGKSLNLEALKTAIEANLSEMKK